MRVLHVVPSLAPEWGGPAFVVKDLTKALVQKGIDVTVFTTAERGAWERILQPEGVEIHTFEQDFLFGIWRAHSFRLVRSLHRKMREFDLVHIHGLWHYPHFAAYRAARRAGEPYIVTVHGALEPWALGYKRFKKKLYAALIQRRILNEAAAIHAITQEEVRYIQAFGVDNHIVVIPNGIEPGISESPTSRGDGKTIPHPNHVWRYDFAHDRTMNG